MPEQPSFIPEQCSFIPQSLFCFLWSVSIHCFCYPALYNICIVICLLIKRYHHTRDVHLEWTVHTTGGENAIYSKTSSSTMADRPCDCLHPKSPLCSCQHCQWFCAGRDAVPIRRARITRPKRHLPNAYEILVTRYDQFSHGGGSLSANIWIFHRKRGMAHQPLLVSQNYSDGRFVWYQNIRSALFSFVTIRASNRQTDGQTDRIATAIPCAALHAVAQ